MKLKPLEEQVVVVMGASSGIGRAAALACARRGAKLVVSARHAPGLDSLVDEIRRAGGEAHAVPADVTDFEQVRAVADAAVTHYGRLDTWIHTAAVMLTASFADTTPEEFKRVIETNLVGQAYGAKAALTHLRKQERGALILVSSAEGIRALPLQAAYGASKHGIVGMADAIRTELQHEGLNISVTTILPATINTPFYDKARTKVGRKPQGMPPIYQPEIVADAIAYAAENPTRHLFVGEAARVGALAQAISPRLVDAFLARTGFQAQRTGEPKSAAAPDNLFAPIDGFDRTRSDLPALPISPYTALQTRPALKWGLGGLVAAVAAVALLTRTWR